MDAKEKRITELADSILPPGVRFKDLTKTSRTDFGDQLESVIERGKENQLFESQHVPDRTYHDKHRLDQK